MNSKRTRRLVLLLLFSFLLHSCQAGTAPNTIPAQEDQGEVDTVNAALTEIRKICTKATPGSAPSWTAPEGHTRAAHSVSAMELGGYVKKMIAGNIENWALSALEDNPNIVAQIARTGGKRTIGDILGDAFGQISDGILSVSAAEDHGWDGGPSIAVNSKKTGTYGDIDYRIAAVPGVRMDWRGAREVWFYTDLSSYSQFGAQIGFALQEQNPRADEGLSGINESWGLRVGSTVSVLNLSEGEGWQSVRVVKSQSTDWNAGRVKLPGGFVGWVAVPLERKTLAAYWASSGAPGDSLDLREVNQLQICVEGNSGSPGKTLYLSGFRIVGDGFENPLPDELGGESGVAYAPFFPLDGFEPGESYAGSLMPWYDEFPGKLLTGIAENYAILPSQELKRVGDELALALREAQKEDGYLGIYAGDDRFGGGSNWDVWGHYHSIYGLLSWYRATGNGEALDTAIRAADCVWNYFTGSGRTYDSAGWQTMNLSVSHAFAELAKETGDEKYLKAAVEIVEEDWPRSGDWMRLALDGKDFYESSLPRWEALHTILTLGTLWELTGEKKYYTAFENIWYSIAKTDRHNDGGFTSGEAACGDPYNRGAIETCCTVAWTALSSEYLAMSKNSAAADELELSYYNAMFGSLLDGERYVTYNTPMEGGQRIPSQKDIAFQFHSGSPDFNCCQANVSRGLGELSRWAALTDADALWLNWYGAGSVTAKTPGGRTVRLTETTAYPLDGAVRITLDGMGAEETFTLRLRIPTWAAGSTVTADGETWDAPGGQYFTIDRTWKDGDSIELTIGIGYHAWTHERAASASVYYGPILLAAEGKTGASLSYRDFASTMVRFADDGKHWMQFEAGEGENRTIFYDFASVGKFSSYTTWFPLSGLPKRIRAEKGGIPIWCNTILH